MALTVILHQLKVNKRTVTYTDTSTPEDRLPPLQQVYLNMAHLRQMMAEKPNVPLKGAWPAEVEVTVDLKYNLR